MSNLSRKSNVDYIFYVYSIWDLSFDLSKEHINTVKFHFIIGKSNVIAQFSM